MNKKTFICSLPNCDKEQYARGFCKNHYYTETDKVHKKKNSQNASWKKKNSKKNYKIVALSMIKKCLREGLITDAEFNELRDLKGGSRV